MATSILIMLVDKSGSMSDIRTDAIGSFNSFLEKQKQVPGEARMFVGLFDTTVQSYAIDAKLEDVKPLDEKTYIPNGMTALLDAVGQTITTVNAKMKDYENPRVLLAILTDGQENSSHEYTYTTVRKLLDEKKAEGWEVLFLAAGLEAAQGAVDLGIDSTKTAVFHKNARNYNLVNDTLNNYTAMYRSASNDQVMMMQSMNFSASVTDTIATGKATDFSEELTKALDKGKDSK